jgi:hypothetical protein
MKESAKSLSLISRALVRGFELDTSPRWRRSNTHHTKTLHNILPSKSSLSKSYHRFLTMILYTIYTKSIKHCLIYKIVKVLYTKYMPCPLLHTGFLLGLLFNP